MKKCSKVMLKFFLCLFTLIAGTAAVWWFNLDNKLLYYVVYPMLQKHYNKQERDRRF